MSTFELAVVHPLVLLSVVDHYHRVARDTRKRVLGVLLGEVSKGRIDITNSFAVPFEEDDRDQKIWFLDHSYLEAMYAMFKKVNAREKIVGWYHTGPRLREADLDIHELMTNYVHNPVLVVSEVEPKDMGLPTTAYYAKDQIREDGTQKSQKVFVNIPTEVGATEAEEIGVEHLLRDVKDATVSTLATEVGRMVTGLRGLKSRLSEIQQYVDLVTSGKLPVNHDILYQLQDVMNLLPNLGVHELSRSFAVKSNDMMLVIYVAALIRSVLALHNLIENKVGFSAGSFKFKQFEIRVWNETAALKEKSGKVAKLESGKEPSAKKGDKDSSKANKGQKSEEKDAKKAPRSKKK